MNQAGERSLGSSSQSSSPAADNQSGPGKRTLAQGAAQTGHKPGDPKGKIAELHPILQEKARKLIAEANKRGLDVWIHEGIRSIARQNELYAQGRTKPGQIVTKVKGGSSHHNYGVAIDVVFHGAQPWGEKNDWNGLGEAGKAAGLEWGGDWKFKDRPHFQLPNLSIAQLKKWMADGGMDNVWKQIGSAKGGGGNQPAAEDYDDDNDADKKVDTTNDDDDGKPSSSDQGEFDVAGAVAHNRKSGTSKTQWQRIQTIVGTTADGLPGPGTARAIHDWQKANSVDPADGRIGPTTLKAMAQIANAPELVTDSKAASGDPRLQAVEKYSAFVDEAAAKYGMEANHLKAIMAVESGGDPNASSGVAFGLMQVTRGTWEGIRKSDPDLAQYSFEASWRDPRVNILFGAAVLKSKARSMGVSSSDENFAALAVIAYNAGEGTVKTALAAAKAGGSKDPGQDFLKPEFLKPAIEKYNLQSYYLTNAQGKKRNKSGTKEEAIDLKYREIIRYVPQVEGYLKKLEGASPSADAGPSTADSARPNTETPQPVTEPSTPTTGPASDRDEDDAEHDVAEPSTAPAQNSLPRLELRSAVQFNRSQPYSKIQWQAIQRTVGTEDDGIPGPATAHATFRWQRTTGVSPADGKVGGQTLRAIRVDNARTSRAGAAPAEGGARTSAPAADGAHEPSA